MDKQNELNWVDEDREIFKSYNFHDGMKRLADRFFDAKKNFLNDETAENLYLLKTLFLELHSCLKRDCSMRRISKKDFDTLSELIWKGI